MLNADDLTAHTDFLKRLARSLVLDEHSAEDIAQEAWLTYLEAPPRNAGAARAWFYVTVRNLANMFIRSTRRRRLRESKAAIRESTPSMDQEAKKRETCRQVTEALSELEESLRSILMLRFYQDLSYKEIARRMNVPLDTVKGRMKRGFALMRVKLDEAHNGDRKRWMVALAPLAGLNPEETAAATAGGKSGVGSYQAAWSMKLKTAAGVLLVIGAAAVLWRLLNDPEPDIRYPMSYSAPSPSPEGVLESSSKVDQEFRVALAPSGTPDPHASSVTWQGTLIDYTGLPLGNVTIRLQPPGKAIGLLREEGKTEKEDAGPVFETICDGEGRFEIRDFPPGRYVVLLEFPKVRFKGYCFQPPPFEHFKRWGEVVFDGPGLEERDLHIFGGENSVVTGRVIDESTGLPVEREGVCVSLIRYPSENVFLTNGVDPETGTFCLRCVPEGNYQLLLTGPGGFNRFRAKVLKIKRGEKKENVCLSIPLLGKLKLLFAGFRDVEMADLELLIVPAESLANTFDRVHGEMEIAFEEGPLRVTVSSEKLGKACYATEIIAGKNSEIVIQRADLTEEEETPVTVNGRILRGDGTPAPPGVIQVAPSPEGKIASKSKFAGGFTDEEGRFTFKSVQPGYSAFVFNFFSEDALERIKRTGDMKGQFKTAKQVYFNEVFVPGDPLGRYELLLQIPSGCVKGALFDGISGMPLHEAVKGITWDAAVTVNRRYISQVATFVGIDVTNRFEMIGIPPGDYCLLVRTPKYGFYQHSFSLGVGETLDLGDIKLIPKGIVDLQVVDARGSPVSGYTVTCRDRLMGLGKYLAVPLEFAAIPTTRYSYLPTGIVTLRIQAEGHKSREVTLNLEPGVPQTQRVVLEAK